VRRIGPLCCVLLLLALPAVGGCGPDKAERGLAVPGETTTPESKKDMSETEQQRQQQITNEMQQKQQKEFDAAAGKAPQDQPAK